MKEVIDGASFEPEVLKAIGQAFDEAWHEISGTFGDNPLAVEKARLRLANAVLSVAWEDSRDVAALKQGALVAMALSYRQRHATDERRISN